MDTSKPSPTCLTFPPDMLTPEPRMVNLRQGGNHILGQFYRLMELSGDRAAGLLARMDELVAEEPFELSPGCRLMQELYGPGTDYEHNPYLQANLRNVLVFISTIERLAAEHYANPAPMAAHPAPGQTAQRNNQQTRSKERPR